MTIYYESELTHHGILGQKWGKRNGPPYPLGSDDHSAAEKKAGAKDSSGSKRGLSDGQKKALKTAATAVGTAAAGAALAYGGYKLGKSGVLDDVAKTAKNVAKTAKDAADESKANQAKVKERKDIVKNIRNLSDSDIEAWTKRLDSERRLKDLVNNDVNSGKNFVTEVLGQSGKKVATTVATGSALYAIKYALTKEFNPKDLANYVSPKPKNK